MITMSHDEIVKFFEDYVYRTEKVPTHYVSKFAKVASKKEK